MASTRTIDVAQRSERIYAEQLRHELELEHLNEFVAIEPDSGDYFLGGTLSEAVQSARSAHPDRLAFALRIGHASTVHLGVLAT